MRNNTTPTPWHIPQLTAQFGVEKSGFHWLLAGTTGYHLTDPDDTVRRQTIQYLQDLVRFGIQIGGTMEVVGSPEQRCIQPTVGYAQTWAWFKEAIVASAQVPGAEDFNICIEPLAPITNNNFIIYAQEARRMVEEINLPNVKVILDCYSGTQVEEDFPAEIRKTGEQLGHFHCNDNNQRAPGWGQTDFVPIMRALLDIDYKGYCSIEVFDFEPDPIQHASRGLATLKDALAEAAQLSDEGNA